MSQYIERMSAGFDSDVATQWFSENNTLAYQLSIGYIVLLYVGQRLMKERDPMKLDYVLILWNLGLSLFSIIGTIGILPDFLNSISSVGFFDSYCKTGNYYDGNNGYWVYLFMVSKVFELGDSVFLVLRKRKLIFLHVYHHASVLSYTWLAYPHRVAAVRWGVGMNYMVHSVMYTYFLLRSLKIRTPGWVAPSITSMQIGQFIMGTYITLAVLYRVQMYGQSDCDCVPMVSWTQFFLYFSYLALFVNFFYQSYMKPKKSAKHAE